MSAYLSMAAIVSIPWLEQGGTTDAFKKDRLKAQLDQAMPSQAEFDKRFPADYRRNANPFEALSAVLAVTADSLERKVGVYGSKTPLPLEFKNQWDSRKASIDAQVAGVHREQLIASWNKYRDDVWESFGRLQTRAIAEFETNMSSPMSVQEQAYYFQTTHNWFRGRVDDSMQSLDEFMTFMDRTDETLIEWSTLLRSSTDERIGEVRASVQAAGTVPLPDLYGLPTVPIWDLAQQVADFRPHGAVSSQPSPPEPGLGWGPFGWISKWLLRTKSMALALITGMLGFGLFGAAISTIVRERAAGNPGTDARIGDVVIKGLSAAIVVFLAVEGGLAVFTTTRSQEPNAYVLFFTCLVGAVFSENVWSWAQSRLTRDLPSPRRATDETDLDKPQS